MITISRSLLRQVRSVFRRAGIGKAPNGPGSRVLIQAGSDGLRLRGLTFDTAVEFHQPGRLPVEQVILPAEFLDDCEGRKDDPVKLEASDKNRVTATFSEGGVPQLLSYQAEPAGHLDGFPGMPERIEPNEPGLLSALREAQSATDRESTRYALANIQLRGGQGRLSATDGHQVYRCGGFSFPWEGDLLMPGLSVLKSSEFSQDEPVGIGRAADWLFLIVGYWSMWLRLDLTGRYPTVDSIIPNSATASTRLRLDPADADFLRRGLPRLPDSDDRHHPVTLDLNGRVAIRAKSETCPKGAELVLNRSVCEGPPLTFCTNRRFLERAVTLGFREVLIYGADRPVLCVDGRRQYLWCLLDPKEAVPRDPETVRLASTDVATSNGHTPNGHSKQRRTHRPSLSDNPHPRSNPPVETTNGRGHFQESQAQRRRHTTENALETSNGHPGGPSPIQQAEELHACLRDTLHKTRELIVTLRRQKKQSQIVATTLASLKQLQGVAG